MTLVKKPYPMYYYNQKYKPPTWDFKKILLYVIIAALVVFILTRCSLVHKLEDDHARKKLDKIHLRHPDITAQKLNQWYPPQVGKERIDTVWDSAKANKIIADSLRKIKPVIVHHTDTLCNCVDTLGQMADDNENYNNGFNFGYKVGLFDGKSTCKPSTVTTKDSIPSSLLVQIDYLRKDSIESHNKMIADGTAIHDKNNLNWIFGGLNVILLFLIAFLVVKLMQKETIKTIA